jgi:hypothetical protein
MVTRGTTNWPSAATLRHLSTRRMPRHGGCPTFVGASLVGVAGAGVVESRFSACHQVVAVSSGQTGSLVPRLHEAERTLRYAVVEACSTRRPGRANTGELIRIEAALQLASEAAKLAITIRRRRRLDETQRTEQAVMADAEAAASLGPRHRAFTDSRRVTWDVFPVYPVARPSSHAQLHGTLQQGWLCFDSVAEKRRLSPIPPAWQSLSDQGLEQLSRRAVLAPTRRRRPGQESEPGDRPAPAG